MDILVSLFSLVIIFPLFFILSILIKLDSKGLVFFKQKRLGRYKKHFNILKFRTIRIYTPKYIPTHLLKELLQYITRVGRFIRKTSFDEQSQIINIQKRYMAIIAARPALWNQVDFIKERDLHHVFDIPQGLTGYAQVNGRDELPFPVKAKVDRYYGQKLTFLLDSRIFLKPYISLSFKLVII